MVAVIFACMFVILCVMAGFGLLTWFVPFAFVMGGADVIEVAENPNRTVIKRRKLFINESGNI